MQQLEHPQWVQTLTIQKIKKHLRTQITPYPQVKTLTSKTINIVSTNGSKIQSYR